MSDPSSRSKAWPPATAELNNQVRIFFFVFWPSSPYNGYLRSHASSSRNQILELVNQATQYKQLKKGANEGTIFPSSLPDTFSSHIF